MSSNLDEMIEVEYTITLHATIYPEHYEDTLEEFDMEFTRENVVKMEQILNDEDNGYMFDTIRDADLVSFTVTERKVKGQ